jgi:DNA modification methylase
MSIRILQGDCREVLAGLHEASVHCCVTSPPYFGLRDYGVAGQIGLEPTPDEFVSELVAVFREVRRVLRDDGTLWLNLGDSYASTAPGTRNAPQPKGSAAASEVWAQMRPDLRAHGLKPKDLIGIPWMVAKALQAPYYTGQIRDERDRVWLAAIIDGEGCFFIHKRKAGTPSYSRFTRADGTEANYTRTADTFGVGLEVCNTSKAIIDRVQAIAGGGTVTVQSPQQNARRKQTIYRWRVAPNEAKRIAQEVYPHLVGKQHQARLLFNCPSTGEAGAAAHQAMMDLHNGVESAVDYPAPPTLFEPGWYLRQDVIWSKPNAMPESVRDRCTKAHEYLFLLSKSERYYFDAAAMQEPVESDKGNANSFRGGAYINGATFDNSAGGKRTVSGNTRSKRDSFKRDDSKRAEVFPGQSVGTHRPDRDESDYPLGTRNKRSVWTVATEAFKEAHFATFPPTLIEPCIAAGCPEGGTVLDPFGGAGTTGLVADRLQRNAVLVELNPAYAELARGRIHGDAPLFAEVAALIAHEMPKQEQGGLFVAEATE